MVSIGHPCVRKYGNGCSEYIWMTLVITVYVTLTVTVQSLTRLLGSTWLELVISVYVILTVAVQGIFADVCSLNLYGWQCMYVTLTVGFQSLCDCHGLFWGLCGICALFAYSSRAIQCT